MIVLDNRLRRVIIVSGCDAELQSIDKNSIIGILCRQLEKTGYMVLRHSEKIPEHKRDNLLQIADIAVFIVDDRFTKSDIMMRTLYLCCREVFHALDHRMRLLPVIIAYTEEIPGIKIGGASSGKIIHLRHENSRDTAKKICETAGKPFTEVHR